jgi:hypothetical protein
MYSSDQIREDLKVGPFDGYGNHKGVKIIKNF